MRIAILGTRGIPNNYGGFEQFAEFISVRLVNKGHSVTVYNPHFHPYKESKFKGVNIRRCYSPENLMGASANFIYDYLCLKDALKQNFDIIYEAGYHSNAPSYFLMKQRTYPILITNMDGLEWKRSKWNRFTRLLIKELERLAVKKSHYLISDNEGIQEYYKKKFNVESYFIAYGADIVQKFDVAYLKRYALNPREYYMLIARLEPENNIEMTLDGYLLSGDKRPFLIIGKHDTKYGKYLKNKYKHTNIRFLGPVYEKHTLDNLRRYATGYFHGHSVGGTNPSLLEAMASHSLILAHNNQFNRTVLKDNAFYFSSPKNIASIIRSGILLDEDTRIQLTTENLTEMKLKYSWDRITDQHERLFYELLNQVRLETTEYKQMVQGISIKRPLRKV